MTDQELWREFKAGSTLAFGTIFDQYAETMLNYGKLLTSDLSLIEDCTQDVFVKLWEKRSGLGEVVSLKHYLFASLRRRLLRKLQTLRKYQTGNESSGCPVVPVEASYEDWLLQQQHRQDIARVVQSLMVKLTPQQKRVIYLKFYEHLSYDEIAALMKLNKRTVYNTCSAAIKHLQGQMHKTPHLQSILFQAVLLVLLSLTGSY